MDGVYDVNNFKCMLSGFLCCVSFAIRQSSWVLICGLAQVFEICS